MKRSDLTAWAIFALGAVGAAAGPVLIGMLRIHGSLPAGLLFLLGMLASLGGFVVSMMLAGAWVQRREKSDPGDRLSPAQRHAVHLARHELTTQHGLIVADGAAPGEVFTLDTSRALAALEIAFGSGVEEQESPPTAARCRSGKEKG